MLALSLFRDESAFVENFPFFHLFLPVNDDFQLETWLRRILEDEWSRA